MLDPELADGLVRLREREPAGRLGMRKEGRVEVEADAMDLAQSIQV